MFLRVNELVYVCIVGGSVCRRRGGGYLVVAPNLIHHSVRFVYLIFIVTFFIARGGLNTVPTNLFPCAVPSHLGAQFPSTALVFVAGSTCCKNSILMVQCKISPILV